jgi:hypothetical protein
MPELVETGIPEQHIWDLMDWLRQRRLRPNESLSIVAVLFGWQAEMMNTPWTDEEIVEQFQRNMDLGRLIAKKDKGERLS